MLLEIIRDTAARFTALNPVLLPSQKGYETDTGYTKTGNGTTHWNSLAYDVVKGVAPTDILGSQATGSYVLTDNPTINDTLVFNGLTFTFVASSASAVQITIGAYLDDTIANALAILNASVNAAITPATYSSPASGTILATYTALGTVGNAYSLGTSPAGIYSRSASTLAGGTNGLNQSKQATLTNTYSLANFTDPGDATASAAIGGVLGAFIHGHVTYTPNNGTSQLQTFAVETGPATGVYTTIEVVGQATNAGNVGGAVSAAFSFFVPAGRKWKHTATGTAAIGAINGILL